MTKKEQIKADMITAMKNRDKDRKSVLSFLVGSIKNYEIDNRKEATDDEVNVIINKLIKQTQDVLAMIPNDRQGLIDENNFTISVLKEYAPVMMDELSIRQELYSVCEAAGLDIDALTKGDRGKIMGLLMPRVKGKADGKLVNQVVGEYLK